MDEIPINPAFVFILAAIAGLILMSFWARRGYFFYGGSLMYFLFMLNPQFRPAAPLVGIVVAFLLFSLRPQRKRGTKAEVRRRVIAKWTASTGKKFNPRSHEIDHIVPFAKGGSETEDNLRVIERKKNRAKGAKSPWWDLLGR